MLKVGITFAIVIVLHDIHLSHTASLRTGSDDLSMHLETGKVTIPLDILYLKQP